MRKLRSATIPRLVRRPLPLENLPLLGDLPPRDFSPRERKLYIALALIVSFNLLVLCGAVTFFALLFYQ